MKKYMEKFDLYWDIKHYKSQLRCKLLIMKLDIKYKILERRLSKVDRKSKSFSKVEILVDNILRLL